MKTCYLFLFVSIFLFTNAQVPTLMQGDKLLLLPGNSPRSPEVKALIADYKLSLAGEDIYQSAENTNAIELVFLNDKVYEVHLYNEHKNLGSYKNKLPNSLKFGMSANECIKNIGKKPSYQDYFYLEYDFDYYSVFCWFEDGYLTEYSIIYTR